MMDLGTLSVDVLAGLVLLGWWLTEHPGIAVLAVSAMWAVAILAVTIVAVLARHTSSINLGRKQ
jgi:hypothetical protein